MYSKDDLKKQVEDLIEIGKKMYLSEHIFRTHKNDANFKVEKISGDLPQNRYQSWYTMCLPLIKQIAPERLAEFISLYKSEKRKEIDVTNYAISDYLGGLSVTKGATGQPSFDTFTAFFNNCQTQVAIIESCLQRLDSALANIQGTLQADLFDNELKAAQELLKKGHVRASGALAGVTLERHLATVCGNHGITFTKKGPTISDFNEELKKAGIYDVPQWRFISRLGDFRNMSAHPKEREPTKEEIQEMIDGVQKVVKTVF